MKTLGSPEELARLRTEVREKRAAKRIWITVCGGTGCHAYGCQKVAEAIREELSRHGVSHEVGATTTGCHGFCEQGPIVAVHPSGLFYRKVNPEDAGEIVATAISGETVLDRLLYVDPTTGERFLYRDEIPFYRKQMRILLENNGLIDPTSIEDYIAAGGYSALVKVLTEMTPEEVLAQIQRSGLRGRGGAGFPTWRKWELCRAQRRSPKYVICNGDEGDPGAYMDRSLLEGNPHAVIEGMIIAAYAIGDVGAGFIYVRAEYPLAVKHLTIALSQAEELGLLGKDILGTGLDFRIEIRRGAGAFVCGESTALMYSIEGKRGMPRESPFRSVEAGLWRMPTVLNNVKTFAFVPLIIERGADWFRGIGTPGSSGTQVFALTGKVNNTGLVEVPMGITIRELVYEIGGGPTTGRCKAVQIGGPSGGCIPERLFDTPIDFDSLQEAGAMMGSGGLVVMDEGTCMVDVAKYFLEFLRAESCGQCAPCRIGIPRMLEILGRITQGKGSAGDLARLEDLAGTVRTMSLCGLGQTAPNPVLSTLRHFREEYLAHIHDRACPARVCSALLRYEVTGDLCRACDRCRRVCPVGAVEGTPGHPPYRILDPICIRCAACLESCPFGAIAKIPGGAVRGRA